MVTSYTEVEHYVYGADNGFIYLERVQNIVDKAKKKTNNRNDFLVYCSLHICIENVETFMRIYWDEIKNTRKINCYNKKMSNGDMFEIKK